MTNESNHATVTTVRQMVVLAQQIILLDLLENLLKATLQDGVKSSEISPLLKNLNDFAKAQFDAPSFQLARERMLHQLALLDGLISQQEQVLVSQDGGARVSGILKALVAAQRSDQPRPDDTGLSGQQ
jgi:hypothetical protein